MRNEECGMRNAEGREPRTGEPEEPENENRWNPERKRRTPNAEPRAGFSYRSASIGSSRDALNAGYMPKKMPTDAEKPRPIANDHHGSEIGKPEKKCTVQPIPAPRAMPIRPPSDVRNAASIRN